MASKQSAVNQGVAFSTLEVPAALSGSDCGNDILTVVLASERECVKNKGGIVRRTKVFPTRKT